MLPESEANGGQDWALRLEGKTDQEKFKELGWGLRTWDQWNFNECLPRKIHANDSESVFHWGDMRFEDDWPGRIPAQLPELKAEISCN